MKTIKIDGIKFPYKIDRKGNVYSLFLHRFLSQATDKDGYKFVVLHKNKLKRTMKVHRLVALTFIENPNPKKNLVVNHKNEIKDDNRVSNLEWCTVKYNNSYNNLRKRQAVELHKNKICRKPKNEWDKHIINVLKLGYFTHLNRYHKSCYIFYSGCLANGINYKKWITKIIKSFNINIKKPKHLEIKKLTNLEFSCRNAILYFHKSLFKNVDFSKNNVIRMVNEKFLHLPFNNYKCDLSLFGIKLIKPSILIKILRKYCKGSDVILNPLHEHCELMIACNNLKIKYIGIAQDKEKLIESRNLRNAYNINAKILTNYTKKVSTLVTICNKKDIKHIIKSYNADKYVFIIPKKNISYNSYTTDKDFKIKVKYT